MGKTYKVIINKIENEQTQKKLAKALSKLTKKPPKLMFAVVKKAPTVLFKSINEKKANFLRKKFGNTLTIEENKPEEPEVTEEPEPVEPDIEPEPVAPSEEETEESVGSLEIGIEPPAVESTDEEEEIEPEEMEGEPPEEEEEIQVPSLDIGLEPEESDTEEEEESEEISPSIDLAPISEEEEEESEEDDLSELSIPSPEAEAALGIGLEPEETEEELEEEQEEEVEPELPSADETGTDEAVMPSFEPIEEEEEQEEMEEEEVEEPEEQKETIICPECNTPNIEGTRYCELCGFDLSKLPKKKKEPETEYEEEYEEYDEYDELEDEEYEYREKPRREKPAPPKKKISPLAILLPILILAIIGAGGYWAYKNIYLMQGIEYITKDTPQLRARNPRLSPDGKKVAFVGLKQGTMSAWVYGLEEKMRLQLHELKEGSIKKITWSPDSRKILMESVEKKQASDGQYYDISVLHTIDIYTKKSNQIAFYSCNSAWRPDGKWISFINENTRDFTLFNVESEQKETIDIDNLRCGCGKWISKNQIIFLIEDKLSIVNVDESKEPMFIDKGIEKTMWTTSPSPKLSPDRTKIIYTKNETIYMYNFSDGSKKELVKGLTESGDITEDIIETGYGADWLPSGNKIIYTDCIGEQGAKPGTFKIVSLDGSTSPFELSFQLDYMGEPHIIGNTLTFCGSRKSTNIEKEGLELENIFVVDLVKAGIISGN